MNLKSLENYINEYQSLNRKLEVMESFYKKLCTEPVVILKLPVYGLEMDGKGKKIIELSLKASIERMKFDLLYMDFEMNRWKKLEEEPVDEEYEKQKEELKESLGKAVRGQVE